MPALGYLDEDAQLIECHREINQYYRSK
jgi:hypothetical protein